MSTIKQRLDFLCTRFAQAEIARKTGFSPNNVSRYVRGKRMPLEFGRALAEGLGVNPAWLLCGAGEPFMADVAPEAGRTAGDLLSVVEAMQAVTRMRLGSLTGKRHAGVLRELNDSLARHEALRGRLNAHSRKLLEKLMGEMHAALRKMNVRRAAEIEPAAEQVSRLCDDDRLLLEFTSLRAQLLFLRERPGEALALFRRVFMGTVTRADAFDAGCLEQARRFAIALSENGRIAETIGVLRAAMALTPIGGRASPAFAEVGFLLGYMLSLGPSLHQGLNLMQRHAAAMPAHRADASRLYLTTIQYLCGLMDLPTACGLMPKLKNGARRLLVFALMSPSPHGLGPALAFAEGLSGEEAADGLDAYLCAVRVRRALEGGLARGELRRIRPRAADKPPDDAWAFTFHALAALAAGDQAEAAEALHVAHAATRAEPALARMQPALMAMIYRAALALPSAAPSLAAEALEYLRQRVRWGYAAFKPLLA